MKGTHHRGNAREDDQGGRRVAVRGGHKAEEISRNTMATLLKTSRTQVDRLLDPKIDIMLRSL